MVRRFEYLKFVICTKGLLGLILRIKMLISRFDLSGKKLKKAISEIELMGKKYGYRPTLLFPAVILKRHSHFLGTLSKENFEFGIHGYSHKDYKHMTLDEQVSQIQKARETFEKFQVPFYGFRAPYLSWNAHTIKAVQKNRLLWESNEAFIWNGFMEHLKRRRFHEDAIHLLYNPLPAEKNLLIPRLEGDIVRVPIGLPDDEILVDRYNATDPELIEDIWVEILKNSYQRGDIFVLHLHPERFSLCGKAMDGLLNKATSFNPAVWITGMHEVTEWWKEKSTFNFIFQNETNRGYRVKCECSNRATILGRNLKTECSSDHFYKDYQLTKESEFFVESGGVKPCIGVHPQCSAALIKFLKEEGFPYEVSDEKSGYSIFLKEYETFKRESEIDILEKIEHSTHPIVRYWLWPEEKMSALVTTHDLDCLTSKDFFLRFFEL